MPQMHLRSRMMDWTAACWSPVALGVGSKGSEGSEGSDVTLGHFVEHLEVVAAARDGALARVDEVTHHHDGLAGHVDELDEQHHVADGEDAAVCGAGSL